MRPPASDPVDDRPKGGLLEEMLMAAKSTKSEKAPAKKAVAKKAPAKKKSR
ncbi:MAG: hypothetical protein HOH21_00260, partial [Acidimicrobiaceae bacterium]|nr:hypothetical protein [Acidimicrobiaceae bacterium]